MKSILSARPHRSLTHVRRRPAVPPASHRAGASGALARAAASAPSTPVPVPCSCPLAAVAATERPGAALEEESGAAGQGAACRDDSEKRRRRRCETTGTPARRRGVDENAEEEARGEETRKWARGGRGEHSRTQSAHASAEVSGRESRMMRCR